MSLLPLLFGDRFDHRSAYRPSTILDQHFGHGLDHDDIFQPYLRMHITPTGYWRNWHSNASKQDTGSTVQFDKDKFQAILDIQQFKPEEVAVKVTGDNELTIEGKHEEKEDEHGYISRHFVRRYVLPKSCDMSKIESKLSSDGVLTITAPAVEKMEIEHKSIPITQTGEPAKQQPQPTAEQKKIK